MGAKPKPNEQKAVGSNKSGYDRNIQPPDIEPDKPDPPKWIIDDTVALAEWQRVVPRMDKQKILAQEHRAALAMLCHNWSMYCQAKDVFNETGFVIESGQSRVKNPVISAMNEAFNRWHKMCMEFGLTPSARTRIDKPPPDRGGKKKSLINRGRK